MTTDLKIDYTQPKLAPEWLPLIEIDEGSHKERSRGLCVMEAVAWFAGEPHSDRPACACPVIAAYARRTNDRFDQEYRNALRERIPRLVGSKATADVELRRSHEIAFRGITIMLPILFDLVAEIGRKRFPDTDTRTWNAQLVQQAAEMRALTREQGIDEWRAAAKRARAVAASASASASAYASADASADASAYASAYADASAYASASASAYADAYAYALKAKRDEIRAKVKAHALETLDAMLAITA
jgi:hypothetical protein